MWEKIKAIFKIKGIEIPAEKEKEFQTAVEELVKENKGDIDLTKLAELLKNDKNNNNPALEALIQKFTILEDQNKKLLDALGKEITDRESATKATQDQAKKDFEKKVNDAIDKLYADKKITEAEKAQWAKDFTENFAMAERMASKLTVLKEFQGKTKTEPSTGGGPVKTGNKTLDAINEHNVNAAIQQPVL